MGRESVSYAEPDQHEGEQNVSPVLRVVQGTERERTLEDDQRELAELEARLHNGDLPTDPDESEKMLDRYATLKAASRIMERHVPRPADQLSDLTHKDEWQEADRFQSNLTEFANYSPQTGNQQEVEARFQEKLNELQELRAKTGPLTTAEQQRVAILERIASGHNEYKMDLAHLDQLVENRQRQEQYTQSRELDVHDRAGGEQHRPESGDQDQAAGEQLLDQTDRSPAEAVAAVARANGQESGPAQPTRLRDMDTDQLLAKRAELIAAQSEPGADQLHINRQLGQVNKFLGKRPAAPSSSAERAVATAAIEREVDQPNNEVHEIDLRDPVTAEQHRQELSQLAEALRIQGQMEESERVQADLRDLDIAARQAVTTTAEHGGPKIESPDVQEQEIDPKEPSLDDRRADYVRALHNRGKMKIFGGTSQELMQQTADKYRDALLAARTVEITAIRKEFFELDVRQPEVRAALNERLHNLAFEARLSEQQTLRQMIQEHKQQTEQNDRSLGALWRKMEKGWQKMSKTKKIILGVTLGVATGVSLGVGATAYAGVLLVPRMATSVLGGSTLGRNVHDRVARHFQEQDEADVQAAQLTGEQGDTHRGQIWDFVDQQRDEGKSLDDITYETMMSSMDDDTRWHQALERRRDGDRRRAVGQAVSAAAGGLILGGLTLIPGVGKIRQVAEHFVEPAHAADVLEADAIAEENASAADASQVARATAEHIPSIDDLARAGLAAPEAVEHGLSGTTGESVAEFYPAHGHESAVSSGADQLASAPGMETANSDVSQVENLRTLHPDQGGGSSLAHAAVDHDVPISHQDQVENLRTYHADIGDRADQVETSQVAGAETPASGVDQVENYRTFHADHGDSANLTAGQVVEQSSTAAQEVAHPVTEAAGQTVTVQEGDNVWKIIGQRYEQQLQGLSPLDRNKFIDTIKDAMKAKPTVFGLHNADMIHQGDVIDFSKLEVHGRMDLHSLLEQAKQFAPRIEHAVPDSIPDVGPEISVPAEAPVDTVGHELSMPDGSFLESEPIPMASETAPFEKIPMEISDKLHADFRSFNELGQALAKQMPVEQATQMMKSIGGLSIEQAGKKGVVSGMIDQLAGGTEQRAEQIEKTVRKLIKHLPKANIFPGDRMAMVLNRIENSINRG